MHTDIADGAYDKDLLIDIGKGIKNMPYGGMDQAEEEHLRKDMLDELAKIHSGQPSQEAAFLLKNKLHKFIVDMSIEE